MVLARATSSDAFFLPGNDVGVLLIHGFSGTPAEMRGLGEHLSEEGLTVSGVKLAGHGAGWDVLDGSTWREWASSVHQAYAELRKHTRQVFVAGLSMGALQALHLAAHEVAIEGVVALAPALAVSPLLGLTPVLRHVARYRPRPNLSFNITEAGRRPTLREYMHFPINAAHELWHMQQVVRSHLARVRQPLLVMMGRRDRIVRPVSADLLLRSVGSLDKQVVWLERSGHCVTTEPDADELHRRVLRFIQLRTGSSRRKGRKTRLGRSSSRRTA